MAIATHVCGYDYDLVSKPPDRALCKMCQLPSRNPYQSVCCGYLFCKSCLDNTNSTSAIVTATCPVCCDEEFVTFPNKQLDREIKRLHIYCTNKEKGCEWQGELNDINNHLGNSDGCHFEEVKCSNECGKMVERKNLTVHMETECACCKVTCQYCNCRGEYQFIEGQHQEECPKLPLPCHNKCEVGIVPREDMEAHRKECPLEMIQCEYHNVGCEVRMTRKDQKKHESEEMKEHLMRTKLTMTDIESELNSTKLDLTATKHELVDTKITLADTKAILVNTENKLTDTNNQLASALQRISTLEVLLYLATDKPSAMPTSGAVVLESLVRWSDKLVAMVMMSKSGDQECPVILKMSPFNKQKKYNVQWYSDSFYTHHKGYKMSLHIFAAGYGDGQGTHLSVYLNLMKGSHDDELTWPLRGTFEIELLNQVSDSEHHSVILNFDIASNKTVARVTEGDRAKRSQGYSMLISYEELHKVTANCQYLKDDCLFFQVTNCKAQHS